MTSTPPPRSMLWRLVEAWQKGRRERVIAIVRQMQPDPRAATIEALTDDGATADEVERMRGRDG